MRWLLITTCGVNVGDEFARIGTQNIIRGVDPNASFDLLHKEDPDAWSEREFDRAVICGMPLFWSTSEQDNYDIWWFNRLFESWIAKDRRKFMALGVGHVLLDDIPNFAKYAFSINYVIQKTWALTVREPIFDHPKIIDSVCPSAFAVTERSRHLRLCNMMVNGGHFAHVAPMEQAAWMEKQQEIVDTLRERDYTFVAHTDDEHRLAQELGWIDNQIRRFETPEEYLELYSQCYMYFGHRLHGAAVVAAAGGDAWGVASDSRIKMVQRLGGHACRPSEFSIEDFRLWVNRITTWIPSGAFDILTEKRRLIQLLKEFAS